MSNPDHIINPEPCTRISYKYPHKELLGFDKKAMVLTEKVEYEMVRRGYREANIYNIDPSQFDKQIEKITEDGLIFLPLRRVKSYKGFSHKHEVVPEITPDSFVYGVVARDIDVARDFRKAEQATPLDHKMIGTYLGYPDCCTDFFEKIWGYKSLDPIYEIAQTTLGLDNPLLRVHLRYFGFKVIPWFPCSMNCEESSKLSKKWLEVMRSIDEKTTNKIVEILSSESTWSLNKAQVVVEHPLFYGLAAGFYQPGVTMVKYCERTNL